MKAKRAILFLVVLTMLFVFSSVVSATNDRAAGLNITVRAHGSTGTLSSLPSADTIYKDFMDMPMLSILVNFTNSTLGQVNVTNVTIVATYNGTAGAGDYALAFFNDTNRNGYVDFYDTVLLNYTTMSVADGTEQQFNFSRTDLVLKTGSNVSILVLVKNITSDHALNDNITLNVSNVRVHDGENITYFNVTLGNTSTTAYLGNTFTISTTAPILSVAKGVKDPGDTWVKDSTTNHVVMQLNFTEHTGVSQTVYSINLTPGGTVAEKTDVTLVRFYIDLNNNGGVDTTDIRLDINNTPKWSADTGGGDIFIINGSMKVPGNDFRTMLIVLDLASSASHIESLQVNITANTSIMVGGNHTTTNNTAFVGNNMTIDIVATNMTLLEMFDANGDGYLDSLNLTFNETVYVTWLNSSWGFNPLGNKSAFSDWTLTSGNGSTKLLINFTSTKAVPDTGDPFVLVYNGTGFNISDAAGNELSSTDVPTISNISVDRARPIIMSAQTFDGEGDGYIDGYNITFSEPINYSKLANATKKRAAGDFHATNFTVSGYSNLLVRPNSSGNCTADPLRNVSLCLWFDEGSTIDTGATPDLTILVSSVADNSTTPTNGVAINNWMNVVVSGDVTEADKAPPVLMSAWTGDNNADGTVDFINFSFSEQVNHSTLNTTHTIGIQLAFLNGTLLMADDVEGAGMFIALSTDFISDNTNDSINVYINISTNMSSFDPIFMLNTSLSLQYNISGVLQDMARNNYSNGNDSMINYNTTDKVAPMVRRAYGCAASNGKANIGYAINTTGCIVLEFTEPLNHTLSNGSVVNNGSYTLTAGSDEANANEVINITPSAAMSEGNFTIWINVSDNINTNYNWANVTASVMVDATRPTLTWAAMNDTGYNVSLSTIWNIHNESLFLYFSENMTRSGEKDASDFLYRLSGSDASYNAWGAEVVHIWNGAGVLADNNSQIVVVNLTGLTNFTARGMYNGTSSLGGADGVILFPSSDEITDLAGNYPSNSTDKLDIGDQVLTIPGNQWMGLSIPYNINTTMLDERLSGLTTSIYTYNGTHWIARTTSQLTPLEGYIIRINATSDTTYVPINTLAVDYSNPITPSSITLNNGWNLISIDGNNGTLSKDGTLCNSSVGSPNWLNSLCTGTPVVQGAYIYEVGIGNSLTPKDVAKTAPGDLYAVPFTAYWVDIRSETSSATASFSGFGRW